MNTHYTHSCELLCCPISINLCVCIYGYNGMFFDLVDKGFDIWLDGKMDKILNLIGKKKTIEERRIEFEKRN